MFRECQVSGISPVSVANTGLIPAPAYNHLRSEHSPSENPVVAALLGNSSTARHLQQIAPMTAGLAIQATTGLRALPIAPGQASASWPRGPQWRCSPAEFCSGSGTREREPAAAAAR
jgi:hypothetical protein